MAAIKSPPVRQSVPVMLASPTDLSPEQVREVSATVNRLLADNLALYMKTKNFHWHLSGRDFKEYHEMFDEQASEILASVDVLAERVRKLGGTTLRSIAHVSLLQKIEDDDQDFVEPLEMIQRLLKDNQHMARSQRSAIGVCEANQDWPTSNVLQTLLDETERRVWFLFETSQSQR